MSNEFRFHVQTKQIRLPRNSRIILVSFPVDMPSFQQNPYGAKQSISRGFRGNYPHVRDPSASPLGFFGAREGVIKSRDTRGDDEMYQQYEIMKRSDPTHSKRVNEHIALDTSPHINN